MWNVASRSLGVLLAGLIGSSAANGVGVPDDSLPVPLDLEFAVRYALDHRGEVIAMSSRADALSERPAIAGALEDPEVSWAIDHYPFDMMDEENGRRYDWSVAIEQRFPLSRSPSQRRRAAFAASRVARADIVRVRLDVALQAEQSFHMLRERRRMTEVLAQQRTLAEELLASATARYVAGTGQQADVLRAEVEVARVASARRVLGAEIDSAEAMFNASIGRAADAPVPTLAAPFHATEPPPAAALVEAALAARPELSAGRAEVDRAAAEVEVMRSMYRPMAMVRAGRATTMAEGEGAMLMIGISVPVWRGKLRAGVAEAEAMRRMAQADLAAMKLMIEAEVTAARDDLIAARLRLDALERDIVPRSHMAVDAALASYAAGRGALVTVVEAVRVLWDVRTELVMADTAVAQSRARLGRALGDAEALP